MLNTIKLLGVKITAENEKKILEYVVNKLENPKKKGEKLIIFTPNPEQITHAARDNAFRLKLNQTDLALPDGIGLVIASWLLGKPLQARIAGVDFMEKLVKRLSGVVADSLKKPISMGFFGGQPGVAEEAADCLLKKVRLGKADGPKLKIGYASDIFDKQKMIQSDIDILFVALGSPKQEEWILQNKDEIPAKILMAVGGSFDFLSGRIPRAPVFVRSVGLEWLFRLIIQPWRIFRQARLLVFSALILREALTSHLKGK